MKTKQIVLAVDCFFDDPRIIENAVKLAVSLRADINALLFEDLTLFDVAENPLARELVYASLATRRIDKLRLERSLKLQAERYKKQLETSAKKLHLNYQFSVTRGYFADILHQRVESELLIFSRRRPVPGGSAHKPDTTTSYSCSVALLSRGVILEKPVVVIYDGSPACDHALELGCRMAETDGKNLAILIPSLTDLNEKNSVITHAQEIIQHNNTEGKIIELRDMSLNHLLSVIRRQHGRVLLVNSDNSYWPVDDLESVMDKFNIPLLIIK